MAHERWANFKVIGSNVGKFALRIALATYGGIGNRSLMEKGNGPDRLQTAVIEGAHPNHATALAADARLTSAFARRSEGSLPVLIEHMPAFFSGKKQPPIAGGCFLRTVPRLRWNATSRCCYFFISAARSVALSVASASQKLLVTSIALAMPELASRSIFTS